MAGDAGTMQCYHARMNKFKTYLMSLSTAEREHFAERCGTSKKHLENMARGYKPCGPALAVLIERESAGAVTRKNLRTDWRDIWPELCDPVVSCA